MGFWNTPGSAEVHRALHPPDPTLAEDVRVELLLLLPKQACYRYTTSSLCGLPLKFSTPFILWWGPWPSDPQCGFQKPFAFSVGVTAPPTSAGSDPALGGSSRTRTGDQPVMSWQP